MHFQPKNISLFVKITAFSLMLVLGIQYAGISFSAEKPGLTLTQTKATLGLGQKIILISTNGKKVKATSSSSIVKASVYGGNQITLLGNRIGSTKVKICDADSRCAAINVKVQRDKDAVFAASKSKLTMKVGQQTSITTKNGTGLNAWSSSGGVRVSLQGSKVVFNALWGGNATVTICSNNRGCIPVYVNVEAEKAPKSTSSATIPKNLYLDKTYVTVGSMQWTDVTARTREPLIATSDSKNIRTAINGSKVTIYGYETGTGNVKVCDANAYCSTIHVTVVPVDNGVFEVYPTNISLETGQSVWVATKNAKKLTASTNSGAIRPTIKDDMVLVSGSSAGKGILSVCSDSSCIPVYFTVKAAETIRTSYGSWETFYLDTGQTTSYLINRNEPTSYYLTKNSNPQVASVSISDKNVNIKALRWGMALIEICPLLPEYNCGSIGVNVSKNMYCDYNTKTFQLSETDVTVYSQQSKDIYSSLCNGLSAVSNSQIVKAAINGNRITLYGMKAGEDTVKICTSNKLICTSVKVKVTTP